MRLLSPRKRRNDPRRDRSPDRQLLEILTGPGTAHRRELELLIEATR